MKKIMATVLASSMVLGMAAMASAASSLTLKPSKSGSYDYQLALFEPLGEYDKPGTAYVMDEYTTSAFKEFKNEYSRFTTAVKKGPKAVHEYFNTRTPSNVADAYSELEAAIEADSHNSATTDMKETLLKDVGAADTVWGHDSHKLELYFSSAQYGNAPEGIWDNAATSKVSTMFSRNKVTPSEIEARMTTSGNTVWGPGEYKLDNKAFVNIADEFDHHMYTYGVDLAKEVKVQVIVKHGEDFRVDVASGKVTVSRKRVDTNKDSDYDTYEILIKAAAGVRDFELDDFKIEMDLHDANLVYFIQGDVAYSDYREVLPDDRYIITKSNIDELHNDGCIFDFNEVIDDETRIVCNDYVDVLFKGNYDTNFENMRVLTDEIKEVEDFFQDYDINYYDFIGTPKFAKEVTVRVDADSDAYIYEFNKKTGDVTDITADCDYTSDGMTFKRKTLLTYVILEEPYEGGNVKAEKEPIKEEEPEVEVPDVKDDVGNNGSKPNPGTGAYPA